MRLQLSRFDGLRLNLARGWYVVPSHMTAAEVRRLLEVLASGLNDSDSTGGIELEWGEWDELSPGFGPGALAYLRVPGDHTPSAIESIVRGTDLRLGLIHLPDAQCWPSPAWDELEVKSALIGWFRRMFARPDHPLVSLEIASLPLDLLAGATAEPVELIELIEGAIWYHSYKGDSAIERWTQSAYWSIGSRLAARLRLIEANRRREVVDLLLGEHDDHLRLSTQRRVATALVSLGLATRAGDDVALGPLVQNRTVAASANEGLRRRFHRRCPDRDDCRRPQLGN